MTEPPRPPGEGHPHDPTAPLNPSPAGDPAAGSPPPPSWGPPQPPPYSPPPPGYGAPGGGYASNDDRLWTLVAHFGGAAAAFVSSGWAGWIPPLIAMVARGGQSPAVRAHAVAALNFQLLWTAVAVAITVISTCLSVIVIGVLGFFLLVFPWLMGTIFGIIAGIKAMNGEPYRYPGAPNWVK